MPVDLLTRFGKRLRYLRSTRGMSQDQLSGQAGLNRINLSKIENGKAEPGLQTLSDLAKALGLKLVDLVNGLD
jgi:transcriptional regulator with XRE-family HTH domain